MVYRVRRRRRLHRQYGAGAFRGTTRQRGRKSGKKQRGGAFGAGLAAGMMLPLLTGTVGKILKINV